MTLKNARK